MIKRMVKKVGVSFINQKVCFTMLIDVANWIANHPMPRGNAGRILYKDFAFHGSAFVR